MQMLKHLLCSYLFKVLTKAEAEEMTENRIVAVDRVFKPDDPSRVVFTTKCIFIYLLLSYLIYSFQL